MIPRPQKRQSCIERIPRFSFVYEQKRLTLPISQNKIIWVLFTSRKNAIHELIFQNFFFILFLVGKSCVTHDISVVILNLSNWMDAHTVKKTQFLLEMNFLPQNITFLNFIFELENISHHYYYDHGSNINNTLYNNQECLEKW